MRNVRLVDVGGQPHLLTPQAMVPLSDFFAHVAAAVPHGLIPAGWALCDGTNGTPDLRSRFVKGAAAGLDPGATGGAATHAHADHASHTHTVTTQSASPDLFTGDLLGTGVSGTTMLTASITRYVRSSDTLDVVARRLGLDESEVEAALAWERGRACRKATTIAPATGDFARHSPRGA